MQKSSKRLEHKQITSLDEKHSELLDSFHTDETVNIPQLKREIRECKHTLTTANLPVDQILDIKDIIGEKRTEIKLMLSRKKLYLLDNSKYIFDYFEQKQKISDGDSNNNVTILNSFFKVKSTENKEIDTNTYVQSKKMCYDYWKNVNNEFTNMQDYIDTGDTCVVCNTGEMVAQDEEGIMICNNDQCGRFITYIADSSKPNNKDPPNEVSYTAYIRLNHFKEILSQFQAKETTQIPDEVIEAIRARIKKERITDMKQINYDKMREILRKLGLNKYFEHIQYINSLFGVKPPIMNEELHETLCVLFIEIQKPWAVHCPPNRTNFFNYTYTLYQLCTLLDQTQYLPYIPMMKDREKQLEQDMIWKLVCKDLDWGFFPTV